MAIKRVDSEGNPLTIGNALGVSGDKTPARFTLIKGGKVTKADKAVLVGTDIEKDDAFEAYYFDPKKQDAKAQILRPPYQPKVLSALCQKNNSLGQMITTMEVNIDGTGWVIEKETIVDDEADPEEDDEKKRLTEWFDEVFPRISMTTLRRETRRDLEKVGYAFIEVLRAVDQTLMFLKFIPSDQMRLVKLDEAVMVESTVMRDGTEMKVMMWRRERRFAQVQGAKVVYFKEYGASRDLDRDTGEWAEKGATLPVDKRASEVLYFRVHEDAATSYGVPRWINQIPSVLGSRKAEELNLEFFNAGGLPPALIFIQGGELTGEVRKQVQQYLSGKGASMHRGGIVEVHATGGSVDSAGNVKVTVERFGSERMQDSMFENYDVRCEERVRSSFRLPPIFVGKSKEYSFATAFASYTVAEAQVFVPEREEFDEVINNTIMRELNDEYVFRSMPLTVNDVTTQLEALGLVQDKLSDEGLVTAVNEATGLSLKVDEDADEDDEEDLEPQGFLPGQEPGVPPPVPGVDGDGIPPPQPGTPPTRRQEMDTFEMMELVQRWCDAMSTQDVPELEVEAMREQIVKMDHNTRVQFDGYAAMRLFGGALDYDLRGGIDLIGAASEIAEHEHDHDGIG